jgi:WXG100 family type VII secretion target
MSGNQEVRFSQMEQLSQLLADATTGIDGVLTQLEERVAEVSGDWTGEASDAYQKAHAEWDASLKEMRRMLSRTQATHVAVTERYQLARANVSKLWS